jgi:hypothetical protein
MSNAAPLTTDTRIPGTRLTFLGIVGKNEDSHRLGRVRCDCGAEKTVRLHHLTAGRIKSCGCLRAEMAEARRRHAAPGGA